MGGRGSRSAPSLRGSEFVPSVLGKLGDVGILDGLGRKRVKEQKGKKMTGSGLAEAAGEQEAKGSWCVWFLVSLLLLREKERSLKGNHLKNQKHQRGKRELRAVPPATLQV